MADDPITVMRSDMNRLRGHLFQLVESWGRPEDQERAMKGMVRTLTYQSQANLEATLRGQGGT